MPCFNVEQTLYKQKREGVQIKAFSGEHLQITFVKLEPGFVSSHRHLEEQMGYILSGQIELSIGEERARCTRGDVYHIPSDTVHSFRVLSKQPVELLEVFSPPKEENKL